MTMELNLKAVKKLKVFLGSDCIRWVLIGNVAGLCLGYLEFMVILVLQLMLQKLHLLSTAVTLPSFMQAWDFSVQTLTLVFVLVILARVAFHFLVVTSGAFSSVILVAKLRISVFFELLQRKNPKFLSASEVNYRVNEIAQGAAGFCNQGFTCLNYVFQCFVLAGIMLFLTWQATLLGLALFSLVAIVILQVNRAIHPIAEQMPREALKVNKIIERVARNWLLVRILRTQNAEYENIVNRELRYRTFNFRVVLLSFINNVLPQTLGMFLIVAIMYLNLRFFHVEATVFISFIYLFLRFVQSVANAGRLSARVVSQYPQFKIAVNNYFELDQEEIRSSEKAARLASTLTHIPIFKNDAIAHQENLKEATEPPKIVLDQVSFAYDEKLGNVLEDICLTIEKGRQAGIIGRSGSGKSTMLGLILGLLYPQAGKVLINGVSTEVFYAQNKIKTGYVGPEPFLIEGTVRENILYGHTEEKITDEMIMGSLKRARLDDFLRSLPMGLDYRINENGEGLSAGQKQRLALARALLVLPKLLILDEVSANLDNETEAQIAASIRELKGKCTTVIISHKSGILKYADHVFDLDAAKEGREQTGGRVDEGEKVYEASSS